MRVLVFILLFPLTLGAQLPNDGVNQTISTGGYSYKVFTPVGYTSADPSKIRFLVNFVGDGETTIASTENSVLGKYIKSGADWDGRIVLSNNDTLFVIVMSIPNYGTLPGTYGPAIDYVINQFPKLNKENNTYYAVSGYSGGPGRALSTIVNSSFTYRSLFKRGTFISPTWIGISDYSWSNNGYWHVWYSQNDPNSGTPPVAATDLYSKLNGTKKITALTVACHCATIWDSAMTITGIKNLYRADETYNSTNNRIRWMFAPDDDGSGNIPDPPDPPAWDTSVYYKINIDTNNHLGNRGWNKTPQAWWDNSTAANSRLDKEGGQGANLAMPYIFRISLNDSAYGNFRFRYFNGYATGNITIELYDSNRVRIDSTTFSRGYNNGGNGSWSDWNTQFINNPVPARFVVFTIPDASVPDLREFEMMGLGITANTPVKPAYTPTLRPDPGIKFQGISAIDDKDTAYMKLSTGETFFGSYRQPMNVFFSAYDKTKTRAYQPYAFHYFGDLGLRKLNFMKSKGVSTQLYYNGAWLGALNNSALDSASDYGLKAESNKRKDIDVGADSTSYAAWALGSAKLFATLTAKFGNNTNALLDTSYKVYKLADHSSGQNKIQILEIGNEDNQTWNGLTAFHSVPVAVEKLKSAYDSVKKYDPNMQVYIGATYYADSVYLKAMYWEHFWKYGERRLPADGFCFNQYLSSAYRGQPKNPNTERAVTPEMFRVEMFAEGMAAYRDGWQPGNGINWTESGFAKSSAYSNYKVKAIENIPDTFLMANLNMRLYERVSTVKNGIDVMHNYFFSSDGSNDFGTMVLATNIPDPQSVYRGMVRHPNWWWFATRYNAVKNYKGWADFVRDGDSTSYSIIRRDHLTDENKKLFFVTLGTYEGGSLGETNIELGSNVLSARLIEFVYGSETGEITDLVVSDNRFVNITVDEYPRYIEVTYGSDPGPAPVNKISKPAGVRWNLKPVQN